MVHQGRFSVLNVPPTPRRWKLRVWHNTVESLAELTSCLMHLLHASCLAGLQPGHVMSERPAAAPALHAPLMLLPQLQQFAGTTLYDKQLSKAGSNRQGDMLVYHTQRRGC